MSLFKKISIIELRIGLIPTSTFPGLSNKKPKQNQTPCAVPGVWGGGCGDEGRAGSLTHTSQG